MGRTIPQIIATVTGIVLFLVYFSAHPVARAINQQALDLWQILFAFALIVGVIGFVRVNMRGVARNEDRWYRLLALAGTFAMVISALVWGIGGSSPFTWIFQNIQVPMQATVFSLLAFFVASASLRGFRARSLAATVLLLSALLILLSRTAIPAFSESIFTEFADWLRNTPSMAARRAILIGIGLGSLTTSLRVILGIERTWLGGSR